MQEAIIVAAISLVGTLAGTFGGIMTSSKLTGYRIEQLEKKVEQLEKKLDGRNETFNDVFERVLRLEDNDRRLEEKIDAINSRIGGR